MNALRALKALGPIDARSVRRDALLRWIVIFPLLIAVVVRLGLPWINARLLAQFQLDIAPYYPLVMSFIFMTTPLMVGVVIGFLLLDQRDDLTLSALQVTPLSLNNYLVYRIALPSLLSLLVTILIAPLIGLVWLNPAGIVLAALAAAPLAPLYALFLAAFAANKVQGFALSKLSGIFLMPALIAYFVRSGWQAAFGLAPTYWPARLYWALDTGEPGWPVYLLAGLLYQALLLALLVRRFNRVMHEEGG